MGRLPGGIIDDFRDHIAHEISRIPDPRLKLQTAAVSPCSPSRTLGGSLQPGTPRTRALAGPFDVPRHSTFSPILSGGKLWETLTSRARKTGGGGEAGCDSGTDGRARSRGIRQVRSPTQRFRLRETVAPGPRNFYTRSPPRGHYASSPGLNVGYAPKGCVGEYEYQLVGPAPPVCRRDVVAKKGEPRVSPFRCSSPAKRINGSCVDGLFSQPEHRDSGSVRPFGAFEATSCRFISQQLYPVLVLPTAVVG